MNEEKKVVLDAMSSPIGRENWACCTRMLVHDLIDMAPSVPEIKRLLDFYSIEYHPAGGFTMALPRLKVLESRNKSKTKKAKIKKKK
jgi:hypothetical protein